VKVYVIVWSRQKGKIVKKGITNVVSGTIHSAILTFTNEYPGRDIINVSCIEGDVLVEGYPGL
jgi:hypothetical protein